MTIWAEVFIILMTLSSAISAWQVGSRTLLLPPVSLRLVLHGMASLLTAVGCWLLLWLRLFPDQAPEDSLFPFLGALALALLGGLGTLLTAALLSRAEPLTHKGAFFKWQTIWWAVHGGSVLAMFNSS